MFDDHGSLGNLAHCQDSRFGNALLHQLQTYFLTAPALKTHFIICKSLSITLLIQKTFLLQPLQNSVCIGFMLLVNNDDLDYTLLQIR